METDTTDSEQSDEQSLIDEAERKRLEAETIIEMRRLEEETARNRASEASVAPGYEFGRGIGVLQPPTPPPAQAAGAPLPMPGSRNRMYMGPASGAALDAFTAGQGPSTVNLMPPPAAMPEQDQAAMQSRMAAATGGESDASATARLQTSDRPGLTTIGVRSEPPYSDASLANRQNMMRYNAMKAFDAGDRSPEVIAAAMGSASGARMPTPAKDIQPKETTVSGKKIIYNPQTGAFQSADSKMTDVDKTAMTSELNAENSNERDARKELERARKALSEATTEEDRDKASEASNQALADIRKAQSKKAKVINQYKSSLEAPQSNPNSAPIPVPQEKKQLVSGQRYQTTKGILTWDGSKFVR